MSEFDNTHPIEEGIDPTALWGSYASNLLQLIREARPSTLYGMVIYSTDTPPTTGIKEWHKRSIWIQKPTPPETKYNGWYFDNNTGSWEYLDKLLNTILAPGSITLAMLDPDSGSALQLLRKNAANDGHEYVDAADIFEDGSLSYEKISAVPDSNTYVLASISGGMAFIAMADLFSILSDTGARWRPDNIRGVDAGTSSFTAENKVLSVRYADGNELSVNWRYIEDLMRANQTPFSKMIFPPGKAGLGLKVNEANNDIEFYAIGNAPAQKFAIICDRKALNTPGDIFTGAGPHTLTLNYEVSDADNIVVVASNRFVPIAGKYSAHVIVPISHIWDADPAFEALKLYVVNLTTAAIHATMSCAQADNASSGGVQHWILEALFTANGTDEYAILAKGDATLNIYVGVQVNIDAEEYYTTVKLHRYAD